MRIVPVLCAALLLLSLLELAGRERPVPNHYVGEIQVTGTYTTVRHFDRMWPRYGQSSPAGL